jgi:DNA-binding MarR family transcriptional regulator
VPTGKSVTVPELQLSEFVPFRLNRLAAAVSEHLSVIYRERFGLEIPEWRVLVTIGRHAGCTAQQIVHSTRMHKTRVSRAVAALRRRALLEGAPGTLDAREMHLRLTPSGRRIYASLVPLALARESELLACLRKAQRQALLRGIKVLESSLGLERE